MAKIFRFSGYFVDGYNYYAYNKEKFENALCEQIEEDGDTRKFQQLHIEESNKFEIDGELEDTPMEYDRPLPKVGELYRHFKLGKCVLILGISRHTETEEIDVLYEYGGNIWSRPLDMFMSEVDKEKYPNATQKYRFERVA